MFGARQGANKTMWQRHSPRQTPVSRGEIFEARFKRFMRELSAYERKLLFHETLDTFLDLYSAWKKTREPWMKVRLVMLAFELNRLDASFECDLAFHDEGP